MKTFALAEKSYIYFGSVCLISGLIFGVYILGVRQGVNAAESQYEIDRAESVIEFNQVNKDLVSTQIKLTECEARAAGDCALDCESITQERVSQALASCAAICRD
tara:strand:- start:11 stop:325 length:315 start_codon:yes stop_codon:yes gene_type:complete